MTLQLDYADEATRARPVSALAVVCCTISALMLPCGMIRLFVPAELFNSVDIDIRGMFWSCLSGLPALAMLLVNRYAAARVKRKELGGVIWAAIGMMISVLYVVGAVMGLGVAGID